MDSVQRLERLIGLGVKIEETEVPALKWGRYVFLTKFDDGGIEYVSKRKPKRIPRQMYYVYKNILRMENIFYSLGGSEDYRSIDTEAHYLLPTEKECFKFELPERKFLRWQVNELPQYKQFASIPLNFKMFNLYGNSLGGVILHRLDEHGIQNVSQLLSCYAKYESRTPHRNDSSFRFDVPWPKTFKAFEKGVRSLRQSLFSDK